MDKTKAACEVTVITWLYR